MSSSTSNRAPAGHPSLPPELALARPIFVCELEQLGGAERGLLALSAWLHQQGLPHYLLTYYDHCDLAQYASHPVRIVALNPKKSPIAKIAALHRHVDARPAAAPQVLCCGYQEALHATLAGLRGFHDLMFDTPSLFGDEQRRSRAGRLRIAISSRIIGNGLRSGGQTIVNSEYLKSECRKDFGVQAEIVRMGGLSAGPAPHPDSGPEAAGAIREATPPHAPSSVTMLSVCRLEANKRLEWILRALGAMEQKAIPPLDQPLSQLVDWHLDVAGKGSLRSSLEQLAAGLGIATRVRFHGFVSDADLLNLYAGADLFLMPAVQGYGLPALEAIDRGIPVILHRDSGVSDILLDTPWATVFSGGEDQLQPALAQALQNVVNGTHRNTPPPHVPTEAEWAHGVSRLCGWLV